eukprot:1514855-Pyramimonas_sp.AAC.1
MRIYASYAMLGATIPLPRLNVWQCGPYGYLDCAYTTYHMEAKLGPGLSRTESLNLTMGNGACCLIHPEPQADEIKTLPKNGDPAIKAPKP